MRNIITKNKLLTAMLGCTVSVHGFAAPEVTPQDKNISNQQLIYQQERQKAIEETLSPQAPDVRLLPPLESNQTLHFPQESLCFQIDQVELLERDALPYIMPLWPLAKQAEGQ